MCYPSPGPRCSASASRELLKATQALRDLHGIISRGQEDEYMKAKSRVEKAQREYDMTPAGIKELERRDAYYNYKGSMYKDKTYSIRLEIAKRIRAERLAALKLIDQGDLPHKFSKPNTYGLNNFTDIEEDHPQIKNDDPQVNKMVEESAYWISKLTPDEIEAVAWFTSDGASVMNYWLEKQEIKSEVARKYSKKHVEANVEALESALNKFEIRKQPVITYRGTGIRDATGKEIYDIEELAKHFQVGDVISTNRFQSSTIDPSRALSFESGVVYEIKSKKTAPLSNVSAWGLTEKEFLVPRNTKLRVVDVIQGCKINGKHQDDVLFVQLEDVDD